MTCTECVDFGDCIIVNMIMKKVETFWQPITFMFSTCEVSCITPYRCSWLRYAGSTVKCNWVINIWFLFVEKCVLCCWNVYRCYL